MKCYNPECENTFDYEGHSSVYCSTECKNKCWQEIKKKKDRKYTSISDIQERCKELAQESKVLNAKRVEKNTAAMIDFFGTPIGADGF